MRFKASAGCRLTMSALCAAWVCGTADAGPVTPEGFEHKTFVGYQAWFNIPADGQGRNWFHWSHTHPPTPSTMSVDMWPDVAEYPADALQATGLSNGDGSPSLAYSSASARVIDTHFRWMREYDIAGAFLQWFVVDSPDYRLDIARKARASAEAQGRKLVIMFDVSGAQNSKTCNTGAALVECLKTRWRSVVDAGVTASSSYQTFRGKPLLAVWGFGLAGNETASADDALAFVNWLHTGAPVKYRASVMGGVPSQWRTGSGDALSGSGWPSYYASLDIISPWTVGRYADDASASAFIRSRTSQDLAVVRQRDQRYLPVVFPGYSFRNGSKGSKRLNEIPRAGGQFMWTQAREYAALGLVSNYVAMFDEVDEATAIFKLAAAPAAAPAAFPNVTLASDGMTLPPDWYLQVTRTVTAAARQPGRSGFITPGLPMAFAAGTLVMAPGSMRSGGGYTLAFQHDGNLVVYDAAFRPLWATNTVGRQCSASTCSAVLQADGNFILYDRGHAYWATHTTAPGGHLKVTARSPFLMVQAADGTPVFTTSRTLEAPSGAFHLPALAAARFHGGHLTLQGDGNLVVYDSNGRALWASNTTGHQCSAASCSLTFQTDGNLVLRDGGAPYWNSATSGIAGAELKLSAAWPYLWLADGHGARVWPRP